MAPSMLHVVTFRTLALAVCAGLCASDASALSLGQPRGAVLIGRPLEVVVPVTLDAPDGGNACSVGELYDGEARVNVAPDIRWLPGPNGREGRLRISSPAPVTEPVVMLALRVGCGLNATTRRYVLLPELPPLNEAASVAPVRPSALSAVTAPPVAAQRPAAPASPAVPSASGPAATTRKPTPMREATQPRTDAAAAPRPARGDSRRRVAPPPAAAPAPAPQSRLRLAPLELGPERDATLHFSTELTLPTTVDPARRAEAAALWQALNKTPEEVVQEGLKLQALDREIQSLRQLTQQNAAAVTAMREQVQAARADRNQASTLALLLFGLLLAFAGWLAWRWHQSRRLAGVSRWFEANAADPVDSQTQQASVPPSRPAVMPSGWDQPAAPELPSIDRHLQTAPVRPAAVGAAIAGGSALQPPPTVDFQTSQGGTVRMVGVREMLDVHDKADFFLSLGQHEQAIAVLEAHVHDQVETSALPWLDLLGLYHSLGRRRDFDATRAEFNLRFTAHVPDFEHFDEPTHSLENYSRALSRIVALWPSRRVLEVIEESMFRKPGLPGADTFSLEAYRELVLLYHIAQEVAPQEGAEPVAPAQSAAVDTDRLHSGFTSTATQPLAALDSLEFDLDLPLDLDDPAPSLHSPSSGLGHEATLAWADSHPSGRDPSYIPPASPRLGLDIDLTEFESEASAPGLALALAPVAAAPVSVPVAARAPAALHTARPEIELTLEAPGSRELPPLDFDTSQFDEDPVGEPPRRN